MTESKKYTISWHEFDKDSRALAEIIKNSGPIEGIVGIARGGLVATAIISNALNIRNVKTVAVVSYNGQQQMTAELLGSVDSIGDGKGWVFIDDLVDTGQTAKLIRKRYPKALFASVYAKREGMASTDLYASEKSQEDWLIFPWE